LRRRLAALAIAFVTLAPSPAAADWLLTPFIGTMFAGETTLTDLEQGAGQTKWTVGTSFTLLSDGIFGLEFDVAHSPGFFQGEVEEPVILGSRVTSYMGNVIVAAPLGFTRESLRPYLLAGFGVVQARTQHIERVADLFGVTRNLRALNFGGGALGFVSDRTGFRFDIRYLRAVSGEPGLFARPDVALLSFWRASVGVTIRLRS
jgi:hypothetical protein